MFRTRAHVDGGKQKKARIGHNTKDEKCLLSDSRIQNNQYSELDEAKT